MRITIEKDDGDKTVFEHVTEFTLVGTDMQGKVMPTPINVSYGNSFVLIGKLEEMKERLRQYHASAPR